MAATDSKRTTRRARPRSRRAAESVLDIRDLRAWRDWLAANHASSRGIWLVVHKAHTGIASIPYEDAVREALCVGWIDSLVKRLDEARFARKFTPRTPTSRWSDINRTRWSELKAQGALKAPGLAAAPTSNRYPPRPRIPLLPAYIRTAIKSNAKAWEYFSALTPSHRRNYVVWIHTAKRPDTRERRIREAIRMLEAERKLGLK